MDKTYVFENGGSEATGLLNSIIPALQNKGVDTAALLAAMGNNNGGLFGGRGFEDIIALIIVAAIFGNGNGFGFGNGGNNSSTERELLANMIQRNGTDLNALAGAINCSTGQIDAAITAVSTQICNLAGQNGLSFQQVINSIQAGNATLASQIANCCCENRLAICNQTNTLQNAINGVAVGQERGFSSVAYATAQQTCDLQNAIKDSTAQILEGQRAAEMREMQDKLDALRERNSQQATMLNNAQQTAAIGAMISPLAAEIEKIKCRLPETYNVQYQPFTAIPNCVAAQYGLYGGFPYGTGTGFFG